MSEGRLLVKAVFGLPKDSPIGAESLWAKKVSEGKYRLDNSPLYVYGYSLGDVVSAVEKEGILEVEGLCIRGGILPIVYFLQRGWVWRALNSGFTGLDCKASAAPMKGQAEGFWR